MKLPNRIHKIRSFTPSLGIAWAVVVVFFAGASLLNILLALLWPENNSWRQLAAYVLPFGFTVGCIYLLQRRSPAEETLSARPPFPKILFLLLPVFTLLLAFVIEPLSTWLPMPETWQAIFAAAFQPDLPCFLTTVVAAPLCEEWLCRGVICRGMLRHGTPAKAIVWSALIFAVIHLNPWQAIPAFIIGLLLGVVYWKTQSLIPCILIHAVNNGGSFAVLYGVPEATFTTSWYDLLGNSYPLLYGTALLLTAATGYALYRALFRKPYST